MTNTERSIAGDVRGERVVGRDPVAKTITHQMIDAHPDWTDEMVAGRINDHYAEPVITAAEVAHWRAEA
jgi:hypothetical protein